TMFFARRLLLLVVIAGLAVSFSGCPVKKGGSGTGSGNNEQPEAEHHGHSHDEGPSGGHVIPLGDEEYHVEWLHDDEEGLLTFIVLDSTMENEVPIDAENIVVDLTLENEAGEKQTQKVLIPAVGRTEENQKSARFELADKAAMYNITENEKVDAVLHVTIGGKEYSAPIEHDAHHGHSHSHD